MYNKVPGCTTIVLAALLGFASSTHAQAPQTVMLVHAGRLLDRPGQAPRTQSTVVIRAGRIEAIRDGFVTDGYAGATIIDLRERFVLPGLIDSHVHLDSDKAGQEGLVESLTNSQA